VHSHAFPESAPRFQHPSPGRAAADPPAAARSRPRSCSLIGVGSHVKRFVGGGPAPALPERNRYKDAVANCVRTPVRDARGIVNQTMTLPRSVAPVLNGGLES